jgi:hypothetical protein
MRLTTTAAVAVVMTMMLMMICYSSSSSLKQLQQALSVAGAEAVVEVEAVVEDVVAGNLYFLHYYTIHLYMSYYYILHRV